MKIGIIGAIDKEIKALKKIIKEHAEKKIGNYNVYIGKCNKHDVCLIKSGVGKVSSSIATMILINLFKPDIIINSGSAGSLKSSLKIGDIIIPEKICYYDVDLTNFGYEKGQIPEYPKKFKVNEKLHGLLKRKVFNKYSLKFSIGLIVTGDSFIRKKLDIQKIKKYFSSAIAVEMESAGIAQVCYQFNIPLIIIKSISDSSDENASINFKKNISIASHQSSKYTKIILKNIIDM